jgi:phosphate-selective porin OprO/OprP
MSLRLSLAGAAIVSLPLGVPFAQAQDAPSPSSNTSDPATLQQRLEEQEQRLKILERKLELQEEAAKAAAASTPAVKASPSRLSFQSADGANSIRFRGVLHFDGRDFLDDTTPETADTWLLRRVRPIVEGTLNNIYDFRFTPDFAGGRSIVQDAYIAARFRPWAVVTAGKFKVPVGLERWQSATDIRFVERAFPTSLVPNRDLGVQFGGDLKGGTVNYTVGYFNGVSDGSSSESNASPDVDNDTRGDWAARVFLQPFLNSDHFALRGLGFGVGGTYVKSTGSATNTLLPSYRTPGQQNFFSYRTATAPATNATFADGERIRWTPQFYYSLGKYSLLGEYVEVSQEVTRVNGTVTRSDSVDNTAWHLQFAWFITGEEETFKGFTPQSTFEVGKPGWGAWELVARVHELSIDDEAFTGGADSFANIATSARKAKAVGVGVNWYLNQNIKWSLNYERTQFTGGAAGGADRDDEKAVLTRFALGF